MLLPVIIHSLLFFQDMLPDYIHMRVAESILFAGKAIRVLRNPSSAFRFQDTLNHQQIPKGSQRVQGHTGRFSLQKEPFMDMQLIGEELLPQSEADKIEAMLQELKVSLFYHYVTYFLNILWEIFMLWNTYIALCLLRGRISVTELISSH